MILKSLKYIICIIGLISIMPVLLIISILILIEDGFPIIYKQSRLGINQSNFTIYKLRTMRKNSPQIATHEVSSKYFLKIGHFIRKTKLDEFPQLFNILIGDLNFVGPRPGMASIISLVEERERFDVYSVKPGITGLSQILGFDMSKPTDLAAVDKIYIENQSIRLDLIILSGTFFRYPKRYIAKEFQIECDV